MTPGARVESAIGLLSEILPGDAAADATVRAWFRKRRYAGSKDRAAVTGLVYQVLRQRGELMWGLAQAGAVDDDLAARRLVMAALTRLEGLSASEVSERFNGGQYGPDPLSEMEQSLVNKLAEEGDIDSAPDWARLNYPEALDSALRAGLGESVEAEIQALNARAPVDLRVNTLKGDRGAAQAALYADGIETSLAPLSPIGLRVEGRERVSESTAFRTGLVEVQDEGAQLASQLVAAQSGHLVVDYCAGAGGKTLGLAAAMGNEGTIHGFDRNAPRLARAERRFKRAGATCIQAQPITGGDDPVVMALSGTADRVLVDVPCTGSGTWRRAPESIWRTSPQSIADNALGQRAILDEAAPLVRPGGRMVYVTCSVFAEENQRQAEGFLDRHQEFKSLDIADVWTQVLPGAAPASGPFLQLTPLRNQTDGFFIAVFERKTL